VPLLCPLDSPGRTLAPRAELRERRRASPTEAGLAIVAGRRFERVFALRGIVRLAMQPMYRALASLLAPGPLFAISED
jgi:hypothetical protein